MFREDRLDLFSKIDVLCKCGCEAYEANEAQAYGHKDSPVGSLRDRS